MDPTGIRLSTKQKHELEAIIVEMGDAMRKAYLPYVADSGRKTPRIEWVLSKYVWFAMKVCGIGEPK